MKFVSLTIKQGMFSNDFTFDEGANIVYSENNSVGKTSLLRLLMYSLGYPIPSTRGFNFSRYELIVGLVLPSGNDCSLIRQGDYMNLVIGDEEIGYSLPSDLNALHNRIFGIHNDEVLENLLGAFYIDQEKGWTLLNRGKAIGSIHFSIKGLIRGLSNRTSTDLIQELSVIKRELQKYHHMLDVGRYQTEITSLGENISFDAPTDEVSATIEMLNNERKPIFNELERIKAVIRKNTTFRNYIAAMQLTVENEDGITIAVNEHTLVGFKDDVDYLIIKRKMKETDLAEVDRKIATLRQQYDKRNYCSRISISKRMRLP